MADRTWRLASWARAISANTTRAPFAAVPGLRLAAVCDSEPGRGRRLAAAHGARVVADWRQLVADGRIDMVVIATPHQLHVPMAIAAAEAGKHTLLGKADGAHGGRVHRHLEAAERGGAGLMIGQLLHFALPSLIARANPRCWRAGPAHRGHEHARQALDGAEPAPMASRSRRGGGMLMTAGIHALDLLVWFMGAPVATVFAAAGALMHPQTADDSAFVLLRFPDGRFGQVSSIGYRDGGCEYGMDLVCERGTLRIDFARGVSIGRGGEWTAVANSAEPDWMLRALEREWQALLAAVRTGALSRSRHLWLAHIIACIQAALQSNRERREVTVMP